MEKKMNFRNHCQLNYYESISIDRKHQYIVNLKKKKKYNPLGAFNLWAQIMMVMNGGNFCLWAKPKREEGWDFQFRSRSKVQEKEKTIKSVYLHNHINFKGFFFGR